jgi:hypothetical protein
MIDIGCDWNSGMLPTQVDNIQTSPVARGVDLVAQYLQRCSACIF